MIFIKNFTVFKCDISKKYHWSKLPKLIKIMSENILNLYGADLYGADLYGADLRGADLRGADLRGADLRGAKLYGANKKTPEKLTIKDFMSVQGLGSQNRTTYFFDTEEIGIVIQCGCFYGTVKAFKKAVKETHKDGQFAKEYLTMLKVVKIRFSRGSNKDD